MTGPLHFERHAHLYTRARPPYPAALWDRLRALGLLRAGGAALDVGAGTGQATGPLLAAGMLVTALEPGHRLATELRARYPEATVDERTAEEAELAAGAFDLAVAATSVHWLDLDVVLPRLHAALADDGHLAVWKNEFGDKTVSTPFRDRVHAIVERRDGPARTGPVTLDEASWPTALSAGGWFEVRHVETFRWSVELDADQVRDLFTTFSNWSPDEVEQAAGAARELGGAVTEHYTTPLVVLRRATRP
jgi:SAM-dependent methyltransferase